jgi:hypothetical protein
MVRGGDVGLRAENTGRTGTLQELQRNVKKCYQINKAIVPFVVNLKRG